MNQLRAAIYTGSDVDANVRTSDKQTTYTNSPELSDSQRIANAYNTRSAVDNFS